MPGSHHLLNLFSVKQVPTARYEINTQLISHRGPWAWHAHNVLALVAPNFLTGLACTIPTHHHHPHPEILGYPETLTAGHHSPVLPKSQKCFSNLASWEKEREKGERERGNSSPRSELKLSFLPCKQQRPVRPTKSSECLICLH